VQKREEASIKHDISIPVAAIPAFITKANAAAIAVVTGARPMPFGHVGDGNIHYNITQPPGMDKAAFMAREDDIQDAVFGVVARYGGSISAVRVMSGSSSKCRETTFCGGIPKCP
jgi:FAD/FMN-containing dehydrogenase